MIARRLGARDPRRVAGAVRARHEPAPGPGERKRLLTVFTYTAKDGSRQDTVEIPLELAP
ncbi:MAG: hypothetical protein HY511_02575 [Actinobacteria bacterium]|nr:hypothetical protein [Actinomycetota bacterium]